MPHAQVEATQRAHGAPDRAKAAARSHRRRVSVVQTPFTIAVRARSGTEATPRGVSGETARGSIRGNVQIVH
jgi:hypothetical protein